MKKLIKRNKDKLTACLHKAKINDMKLHNYLSAKLEGAKMKMWVRLSKRYELVRSDRVEEFTETCDFVGLDYKGKRRNKETEMSELVRKEL